MAAGDGVSFRQTLPLLAPEAPVTSLFQDPRHYQITCLSLLLGYGLLSLDFEVQAPQVLLTLLSAQIVQYACTRLFRMPQFEWRSALISSLSLCLLLRSNDLWVVPLASSIAIGSKFVLRWQDKHIFNPTNLALVCVLALDIGWVSPGQWGNTALLAFAVSCLGGMVLNRAARQDITLAFLCFWGLVLFGRSALLGEPMTIPLHRLQSGSLLLFSFFMISDPRPTPSTRWGRILFAALVAAGAWYIQFKLFKTNSLLWSLVGVSCLTPLIDRLLPGRPYQWPSFKLNPSSPSSSESVCAVSS